MNPLSATLLLLPTLGCAGAGPRDEVPSPDEARRAQPLPGRTEAPAAGWWTASRELSAELVGSRGGWAPSPSRPSSAPTASWTQGELAARVAAARLPGLSVDGETSMRALVRSLAALASVNAVVTQEAEDAVDASGRVFELQRGTPISFADALSLVVDLADAGIAWEIRHGVVYVTTEDDLSADMVTVIYDVADLTRAVRDFPAREMALFPSGYDPPEEEPREPLPPYDPDALVDLIQSAVEPDSWDADGVSITLQGGKLIVRHRR